MHERESMPIRDPEAGIAEVPKPARPLKLYKDGQDPEKVAALKQMIEYGLTDGQAMAEELGYISMPAAVIEKGRIAAERIGAGS